jgi:Domain of unknown function (DUF4145)
MKCPHCNTSIHEGFGEQIFWNAPIQFARDGSTLLETPIQWSAMYQRCAECHDSIIYLRRLHQPYATQVRSGSPQQQHHPAAGPAFSFMAYPTASSRPIPAEVVDPYRQDFTEACKVLADSPKASAALSRRLLQAIIRDKSATKAKDLYDQIEEVTGSGNLPSHISEGLHVVRNIGNIAAHSLKSTTTGAIVDVEPGEAEWNLDVIDMLFDFYFVQPAIAAKRKAELNKKLRDIGKPELP